MTKKKPKNILFAVLVAVVIMLIPISPTDAEIQVADAPLSGSIVYRSMPAQNDDGTAVQAYTATVHDIRLTTLELKEYDNEDGTLNVQKFVEYLNKDKNADSAFAVLSMISGDDTSNPAILMNTREISEESASSITDLQKKVETDKNYGVLEFPVGFRPIEPLGSPTDENPVWLNARIILVYAAEETEPEDPTKPTEEETEPTKPTEQETEEKQSLEPAIEEPIDEPMEDPVADVPVTKAKKKNDKSKYIAKISEKADKNMEEDTAQEDIGGDEYAGKVYDVPAIVLGILIALALAGFAYLLIPDLLLLSWFKRKKLGNNKRRR